MEMCAEIVRQRNLRLYDLGISYFGRTYAEGKLSRKISVGVGFEFTKPARNQALCFLA
jgi:hypothetical protein